MFIRRNLYSVRAHSVTFRNSIHAQLMKLFGFRINILPNLTVKEEYKVKDEQLLDNECEDTKFSFPQVLDDPSRVDNLVITESMRTCNLFNSAAHSTVHISVQSTVKPYSCNECDKAFRRKHSLKVHMFCVHQKAKQFACSICGRSFALKYRLLNHKKLHSKDRPAVCEVCGKSFKEVSSLTKHELLHKDPAFECQYCEFKTRRKDSLKIHERYHIGDKPYKCQVCGIPCRTAKSLTSHMFCHIDPGDIKCSICQATFIYKKDLRKHWRTHQPRRQVREIGDKSECG